MNMISNADHDPNAGGITIYSGEFEQTEAGGGIVFPGGGTAYGRVFYDLCEDLVPGKTYLYKQEVTELSGGLNPSVSIYNVTVQPVAINAHGEARFTVREDLTALNRIYVRTSGSSVSAKLGLPSLTD